jgi:hypothetical protein
MGGPVILASSKWRIPTIAIFSFVGANGIYRLIIQINIHFFMELLGIVTWGTGDLEIFNDVVQISLYIIFMLALFLISKRKAK